MAGKYFHIKQFIDFMGEDLRSSDILRAKGFSKGSKNCIHTPIGGVGHRYGSKIIQSGYGRFGLVPFETTDMLGVTKREIVAFGGPTTQDSAVPWRLVKSTFTITNDDSSDAATVTHVYDTVADEFTLVISRDGSDIVDESLGFGTETTPVYLAAIETVVDAVTDMTMSTPTNAATTPAAFMEILDAETIAAGGGTLSVAYWYWEQIPGVPTTIEFFDVDNGEELEVMLPGGIGTPYNWFPEGWPVTVFTTSSLPTGLSAGTQYYIKDPTTTHVKLSLTPGGAAVAITDDAAGSNFIRSDKAPSIGCAHYADDFPFSGDFKPVSTTVINGVLYCAFIDRTPNDRATMADYFDASRINIAKYDGQRFYRAGLPGADDDFRIISFATVVSAGSKTDFKGTSSRSALSNATYDYRCFMKFVDKAGNIVESGPTTLPDSQASGNTTSTQLGDIRTRSDIIAAMGFNTAHAVATAAASATLTIAVDDGFGNDSQLIVGDIGYFWDESQERFIQREILVASGSSITLSSKSLDNDPGSPSFDIGGNVTLNDEAAISANLRIVFLRKLAAESVYQYLAEVPWCMAYTDYFDDGSTSDDFIEPATSRKYPRAGNTILSSFNSQLMLAGEKTTPNQVDFSDIDSPEYHPRALNNFLTKTPVTGMGQSGEVFAVGGKRSIEIVSGDLPNFAFRVDQVAKELGFTSHDSLRNFDETVLAFNTHKGPHYMIGGRDIRPLGSLEYPDGKRVSRIEPFFTQRYGPDDEQPVFERATAAISAKDSLYILFIPFEDPAKPGFATANSVTWVFDFGRGAWWKWTGWNAAGGICELDDIIYFASRSHDGAAGEDFDNIVTNFSQQQTLKGKYNFADHNNYIDWRFTTHWESLGEPGAFKKFLRARISSHETRDAAPTQITLTSYVDYSESLTSDSNSLTWAAQLDLKPKLKGETCRSRMIALESSRYFEPFPLTGLEIEAAAAFKARLKE